MQFFEPCFTLPVLSYVRRFSIGHSGVCAPFAGLALAIISTGNPLRAQAPDRITAPIDPAHEQVLTDHRPAWALAAIDAGAVSSDLPLEHLTLILARSPEQEAAFEQLLKDQQDPASPEYHHWLTPVEVGQRFGLSDNDLAALNGWLTSQGLHVNWVSPSRVSIDFGGAAGSVGHAFQTELHNYKVNGELRMAPASDPLIPRAVTPAIMAVHGLYTVEDKPLSQVRVMQSDAPQTSAGNGSHYIAPGDFAILYDLPASWTGAGKTIGIVGRSRTNMADFANFRTITGSTFANPTEVVPSAYGGVDPGPALTTLPTGGASAGDQGEATLDVLRAGSVAPGANLLLVVASKSSGGIEADAQYLVETTPVPAQIMTISFGSCESSAGLAGVRFWDQLFKTAQSEGISVFVASGDSGASGCDSSFSTPPANPSANSPNYICSSQHATCMGGTEFADTSNPSQYWSSSNSSTLTSALSYIPEGAWNDPFNSASGTFLVAATGGGVSSYISTPSWQTGTGVPAARTGRYTPDLAFSASGHDGYFGCFAAVGGSCVMSNGGFGFVAFSGTSAAAPDMAGITAMLDQMEGSAQGNLNPVIYDLAANSPSAFHDVNVASSGVSTCAVTTPSLCNNSIPGPSSLTGGKPGYMVGTGYDEATGWGSLDVATFLDDYAATTTSAPPSSSFAVTGTTVSVSPGTTSVNISTITVTPGGSFTGTVTLSAAVTSSPTGAVNLPTFSWTPSNAQLAISGTAQTAALMIATIAPSTPCTADGRTRPALPWSGSAAALACLILFGIPARRRRWRTLLGAALLCVFLTLAAMGCGSGSSSHACPALAVAGTTPGNYTITITGMSGSTSATGTVTLTVQ